jgi:hypothetical protein
MYATTRKKIYLKLMFTIQNLLVSDTAYRNGCLIANVKIT